MIMRRGSRDKKRREKDGLRRNEVMRTGIRSPSSPSGTAVVSRRSSSGNLLEEEPAQYDPQKSGAAAASVELCSSSSFEILAPLEQPDKILERDHDQLGTSLSKTTSNTTGKNNTISSRSRNCPSAFVLQITAVASLGGILFGYDLGVISGALPQLMETFDLTRVQQEICVSILYLGGGIGAALGGSLCDSFGRKRAILLTDAVFALGALILFAAPNFETVVVGRVVVGFAVAVSGIADVSYLHEIAPVQFRGAIVSVNEACISLGFLLAFGMGGALSGEGVKDGWRIMFGASGVIALIQFGGMLPLPESPKWLAERGRHEESEIALRRINNDYVLYRPNDDPESSAATAYQSASPTPPHPADTGDINVNAPGMDDIMNGSRSSSNSGLIHRIGFVPCQVFYLYKQFYTFAVAVMREYRRQAYIALFLAVTQQFCGQANVLSYAPLIFAAASGGDAASSSSYVQGWATLSIGLVKFAVTVVVIWKIESIGRRFLLLFGIATIAAGLFLLAGAFAGTKVVPDGNDHSGGGGGGFTLALPGVLLVVCGYSCSFGPLSWVLTSELFPTDIRGRALGASTIITYLCASLVTYTFLTSQAIFGASIVFTFYFLMTCFGLLFALLAIPDTGGKSAEEISKDLDNMIWWQQRQNGSTAGEHSSVDTAEPHDDPGRPDNRASFLETATSLRPLT